MITFNALSLPVPPLDVARETAWLRRVVASHGRRLGEVNYVFCNDEEILDVNRRYLQHDYYTDIITFDYSAADVLSGDLYISLDTVRTNAELFGRPYDEELHRVLVHGVLHLVGINDKGPGEREIMEAAEDAGTVEEVYEPFLIKEGFIRRTPRGREVTELAYTHLGRTPYGVPAEEPSLF